MDSGLLGLIIIAIIVSCVGTVTGVDYYFDNRNRFRRKLKEMNELYRCEECRRYSRRYFIDLKNDCDHTYELKRKNFISANLEFGPIGYYNRFCPHCEAGIALSSNTKEEWIDKHPDAPLLTKKNYAIFQKKREEASVLMYEKTVNLTDKDREVDFVYNDMLLEMSGHSVK